MIGLLAAIAVAFTTASATPAPTSTPTPPVDVVGCVPVATGSGLMALFTNVVRVNYVSHSPKTIRFLQFRIDSGRGIVRFADDPGLRHKNDVVEHELTVESGALGIRAQWTCSVAYALFNDGSTYGTRVASGTNVPSSSPSPSSQSAQVAGMKPGDACGIVVDNGGITYQANGAPIESGYVLVELWFHNTDPRAAVAVRFGVSAVDSFGENIGGTNKEDALGTYSTGIEIEPRVYANGALGNAAWLLLIGSTQAVNVRYQVLGVRYADGSLCNASS